MKGDDSETDPDYNPAKDIEMKTHQVRLKSLKLPIKVIAHICVIEYF